MSELKPLSPEEGIERFIQHREPSVRDSTISNAKSRLRFFRDWCDEQGIENLNELTGRDLADFVDWRRADIATVTLQKQLTTIRQALRYWADIEGVRDGLAEKVHTPEVPTGDEARSVKLDSDRAERLLEYLDRYEFASREHVTILLLWETGMRRSALRSLDVSDLDREADALRIEHRIDRGTRLKNGEAGERMVYLGPKTTEIVAEYIETHRLEKTDGYGRRPLLATQQGRPTGDTIYSWVNQLTRPCRYGVKCPHDRDPEECEAVGQTPHKCPSSRSPHGVRRGHITDYLTRDVPPDTVSERADVSLDILYQHYDARTPREKMEVRKKNLPTEGE